MSSFTQNGILQQKPQQQQQQQLWNFSMDCTKPMNQLHINNNCCPISNAKNDFNLNSNMSNNNNDIFNNNNDLRGNKRMFSMLDNDENMMEDDESFCQHTKKRTKALDSSSSEHTVEFQTNDMDMEVGGFPLQTPCNSQEDFAQTSSFVQQQRHQVCLRCMNGESGHYNHLR